jgi:hypothetical protein
LALALIEYAARPSARIESAGVIDCLQTVAGEFTIIRSDNLHCPG